LASITDTLNRYRVLAGDEAVGVNNIDELGQLAKRGDPFAKESIRVSSAYIAEVTLVLINSLNPDTFVLAGGMASLGSMLFRPIRRFVKTSTFPLVSASTHIVTAKLGIYSGCFGSARLALLESTVSL
jgi:glucokinase